MNALAQKAMFKEMGVKTFYIVKSIDDPKRAIVMFQGPKNVLYDIFINPKQNQSLKLLIIFVKVQK